MLHHTSVAGINILPSNDSTARLQPCPDFSPGNGMLHLHLGPYSTGPGQMNPEVSGKSSTEKPVIVIILAFKDFQGMNIQDLDHKECLYGTDRE